MATFHQLITITRSPIVRKTRRTGLMNSPQKTATLLRNIKEVTPRKPNSAKRKVAWVETKKMVGIRCFFKFFTYLPGNGTFMKILRVPGFNKIYQNLDKNNKVLVRGGRTKDIPGLQFKIVFCQKSSSSRKTYSIKPIVIYNQKRSKYGVKFRVEDRNQSGAIMPFYYAPNQLPKSKKKKDAAVLEALDNSRERCFERDLYNRRKNWVQFNYHA